MKRRNALLTTNALVSAVLVAALLVGLNYLAAEHHVRWDLTATRSHSLAPQTIKVLQTLPGPVQVIAFPSADSAPSYIQMLQTYQYYNKDFQYRIVDPDRSPAQAQQYHIATYGQVVFQHGSASYTADDDSETNLTNGLLHVLQTAKKTVYVIQGEGEVALDDFTRTGMGTAKQALTDKGYDVQGLVLVQTGRIPANASAVILPSPSKDLLPQEEAALDAYYRGGGKLLIMVDPQTPAATRAWLATAFHVSAPGGIVLDPVSRLLGGDLAVPIAAQYPPNDITANFNLATAFPVATPLVPDPKAATVTLTPVVKSSDQSYVKVNLESKDPGFQPGDVKGPAVLAVEVTPGTPPPAPTPAPGKPPAPKPASAPIPKGSAVLFGNSSFIKNTAIGLVGNRDLFVSAVAWLTQSGDLVSIAPRTSPFDPFISSGPQGRYLFIGSVIVLPLVLLFMGGTIYFQRKAL